MKTLEEMIKQYEPKKPKWNGGDCSRCNCGEIAEFENNGNPVKNYYCRAELVKDEDLNETKWI